MRKMVISSDLIFHTAAVQRSDCEDDYWAGNVLYTKKLISCIHESMKKPVIIYTSTINIDYDTPFSRSKLEAERLLRKCSMEMGLRLYVFKLNNLFGKYGKPNYNNVIATYCYNMVNNLPIVVNDPSTEITFTYIEDLMADFESCLTGSLRERYYYITSIQYKKSLGEIVYLLGKIKSGEIFENDEFYDKLKATYWSANECYGRR